LGPGSDGSVGQPGVEGRGGNGVDASGFQLTNRGAIIGGNNAYGIASGGGAIIRNSGVVAAGSGSDVAIHLTNSGNTLVLEAGSDIRDKVVSVGNNSLRLGGDITPDAGNVFRLDSIDLDHTTPISMAAQFFNFTSFGKEGLSKWTLSGSGGSGANWAVSAGTLSLDRDARLTGGIEIAPGAIVSTGDASASGDLVNGGQLHVGLAPQRGTRLAVGGSLTMQAGSTLRTGVYSETRHGQISIAGAATVAGRLEVVIDETSRVFSGDTVSGLLSATSLNGSFAEVVDNSVLLDFIPTNQGSRLDLAVVAGAGNCGSLLSTSRSTGCEIGFDQPALAIAASAQLQGVDLGVRALEHSNAYAGSITNNGVVRASAVAIDIGPSALLTGTLTNRGTLEGGLYAVRVDTAGSLGGIDVEGLRARFLGDVLAAQSPLTVRQGAVFSNDNAFNVRSFTVDQGATFNFGAGLSSSGMAQGVTVSDQFLNRGLIRVAAGTSAYVNGDYAQTSQGVYSINTASNGVYGRLVISGTARLPASAGFHISIAGSKMQLGDTLRSVLSAGSLQASTFSITDDSALYAFTGAVNGNGVDLTLRSAAQTGGPSVLSMVADDSPSAIGAAKIIDTLLQEGVPIAMTGVIDRLGGYSEASQVAAAIRQTLPVTSGASTIMNSNAILSRIVDGRDVASGSSSGDQHITDGFVWAKPFANRIRQSDRTGESGFAGESAGLAFGADTAYSKTDRVGLAFAFSESNTNANDINTPWRSSVKGAHVILYGSRKLSSEDELRFQLGLAHHRNRTTRPMPFMPMTASANYGSSSIGWSSSWSRSSYVLDDATLLTASVGISYAAVREDSYAETGAGPLNLGVARRFSDELALTPSIKVQRALDESTYLRATLGVGYDFLNRPESITSTYAGTPFNAFVSTAASRSPWSGYLGLGYAHSTSKGAEVIGEYMADHRSGRSTQSVSVKFRWAY
jgi:uncharacterized protein with beta-barrel porin domain